MPGWVWILPPTGRYRDLDTGRFLPRKDVLEFVRKSLEATGNATDLLGTYAGNGTLSAVDFGKLLRQEIKEEYSRQYLLGIGGRAQMTPAEWGRMGQLLQEQYKYLDGFVKDLAKGNLTEAQIQARSRLYIDSARQAYETAHLQVVKKCGAGEYSWIVDPSLENCDDCLAFEAMGWVPVGTFKTVPGAGDTACMSNCGCTLLYQDAKGKNL